jgi:hypothetical protein
MFWREIFREVCKHDCAYTITSTRDTSRTCSTRDTTLHRALPRSGLCKRKRCLNEDSSSYLVRRVDPESECRLCLVGGAFNQHKPKTYFWLPARYAVRCQLYLKITLRNPFELKNTGNIPQNPTSVLSRVSLSSSSFRRHNVLATDSVA